MRYFIIKGIESPNLLKLDKRYTSQRNNFKGSKLIKLS